MFDKATFDKMLKEIPKAKLITPSVVSERLKVNGSVARAGIRHLEEQGLISHVGEKHHAADDLHTEDRRGRIVSRGQRARARSRGEFWCEHIRLSTKGAPRTQLGEGTHRQSSRGEK
eukprot:CAMPEP_0179241900 /NCGR_PEP_ID=MMETSP0797-20121207/16734_1 /TAXON_ID=47934 /ORGANISM="Dinophysis acuminata, Strain DAEP01" /LENGTH=116 /DNA_ID=CAMNT_0020949307 /DNA_START=12 /DNA_END=358 /DNA_ORIENTATION=+